MRSKKKNLEEEALEFTTLKKKPRQTVPRKTLTPRQQLAGTVLPGLIQGRSNLNTKDVLTEAFNWADLILEHD